MVRNVKSGSSFWPMRASEKAPAASSSTSRKAVKLPWLIAQRDRLNPFEGLAWMRSADMAQLPS